MCSKDNIKPLWESVEKNFLKVNLHQFREIGQVNERLGTWGSLSDTSRYYKALMYEFCHYLDYNQTTKPHNNAPNFIEIFNKIENTSLGNPVDINYKGHKVNVDYLLSVEELIFLYSYLPNVQSIVEIGAGFGRTVHGILSNFDIEKYFIIDLQPVLDLSKKYLELVLDKRNFEKIIFLNPEEMNQIDTIDLVINIDSMQEMTFEVASSYIDWIN